MEEYTEFAVSNFFFVNKQGDAYFNGKNSSDVLKETSDEGYTELSLSIEGESLWLKDFDNHKKCEFLSTDKKFGLKKSSDHIVFQFKDGEWFLHIFEFKSTVNLKVWHDVKQKFRASYFNCKAIATVLGINILDDHIYAYTTFEKENFGATTTSPAGLKPMLGVRAVKPMDDWNKGKMESLRLPQEGKVFQHTKIQMTRNANGLIGEFAI